MEKLFVSLFFVRLFNNVNAKYELFESVYRMYRISELNNACVFAYIYSRYIFY